MYAAKVRTAGPANSLIRARVPETSAFEPSTSEKTCVALHARSTMERHMLFSDLRLHILVGFVVEHVADEQHDILLGLIFTPMFSGIGLRPDLAGLVYNGQRAR